MSHRTICRSKRLSVKPVAFQAPSPPRNRAKMVSDKEVERSRQGTCLRPLYGGSYCLPNSFKNVHVANPLGVTAWLVGRLSDGLGELLMDGVQDVEGALLGEVVTEAEMDADGVGEALAEGEVEVE